MPTLQDLQAQDAAYAKAGNDAQTAEQPPGQTQLAPHQELIQRASNPPAHVTSSYLDGMLHYIDSFEHDGGWGEAADRVGRDVMVGGANALANTGDAVVGAVQDEAHILAHPQEAALEAEDPAMANRMRWVGDEQTPSIWQHAKNAILDFRDHMQLQDPNGVDKMTQIGAQLAIPFMGASKLLEGIQIAALERAPAEVSAMQDFGPYLAKTAARDATMAAQKAARFVKNVAVPGAMVDGTALQPHAPRMADTLALLRQTEGRFGEALRTAAPDGGLLDGYIRYLTDRGDESEAEGRFKNILDGAGVNAAFSGLMEAVAPVLKQGTAGLRYLVDNGVPSMDKLPLPRLQRGAVSDLGSGPVRAATGSEAPLASTDKGEQPASAMSVLRRPDGTEISEPPLGVAPVREQLRRAAAADKEVPYRDVARNLAQSLAGQNSPYRAVLRQLGEGMDPDLRIVGHENTGHGTMGPNVYGSYNPTTHTVAIHPEGFSADDETLLHTIAHEGVHAATVRALRDPENVPLRRAMTRLALEVDQSAAAKDLRGQARYGLLKDEHGRVNPEEFVAEAAANPELKKAMLKTAAPEGGSLWDEYSGLLKLLTKGALGAGAAATWMDDKKLFDNVISPRMKGRSGA